MYRALYTTLYTVLFPASTWPFRSRICPRAAETSMVSVRLLRETRSYSSPSTICHWNSRTS